MKTLLITDTGFIFSGFRKSKVGVWVAQLVVEWFLTFFHVPCFFFFFCVFGLTFVFRNCLVCKRGLFLVSTCCIVACSNKTC